jgi:hypothetical protein
LCVVILLHDDDARTHGQQRTHHDNGGDDLKGGPKVSAFRVDMIGTAAGNAAINQR